MSKTKKTLATLTLAATTPLILLAPASAHDALVGSLPEAKAQLSVAPEEIVLTFSGEIMDMDGANQIRVQDAEGNSLTDGEPVIDGKTLTQKLTRDESENDTHTVTWRVVSSDGHPIQDSYTYTLGQGAPVASAEASSAAATEAAATEAAAEEKAGGKTGKILLFTAATLVVAASLVAIVLKNRRR